MKVLIVGSGGREYSIGKKIKKSPLLDQLYMAKGNGGSEDFATNIDIDPLDIDNLIKFAKEEAIDLTIVGPENPLALGIVDRFKEEGLRIFGVDKEMSQFESSKDFTKRFLNKHSIPTANSITVREYQEALDYLEKSRYPIVIKADGLCFGKGVFICQDYEEAEKAVREVLIDNKLNSDRVVIEEYLQGEEVSLICLVSNNKIIPLEMARDYQKIGDGDQGENTGGVGCICPVDLEEIDRENIYKSLRLIEKGLEKEAYNYNGVLFVGYILADLPKVLEFNVRFGDPETQMILEKMESDLLKHILDCLDGKLEAEDISYNDDYYCGVVLTSKGYPGSYDKGYEIKGLEKVDKDKIIHSATINKDGKFYTNGGRVMMVYGRGKTREEARAQAYTSLENLSYENIYYRKDIGQ